MQKAYACFCFNLIGVQQTVVDSELHKLGKQVQHLSLQGHRCAGGVLLQSFDHQRLKQTDVVVDGILETDTKPQLSEQQHRSQVNEQWKSVYEKHLVS